MHTDPPLTEADLPTMEKRLELPKGWSFEAKKLAGDLVIDTNGLANIGPGLAHGIGNGWGLALPGGWVSDRSVTDKGTIGRHE